MLAMLIFGGTGKQSPFPSHIRCGVLGFVVASHEGLPFHCWAFVEARLIVLVLIPYWYNCAYRDHL
jgi:hypothetical protein